jgi:hypothetical protein
MSGPDAGAESAMIRMGRVGYVCADTFAERIARQAPAIHPERDDG